MVGGRLDPPTRNLGRGEVFAGLAASAFGSAYVATGFALRSFDPLAAGVYRSFFAAVALALIIATTRRARAASRTVGTALLAELEIGGRSFGGIGWGLVAAVSFALFLVLSRKWGRGDGLDGLAIALATMVVAAVALGVLVLVRRPSALAPSGIDPAALAAMAWLVVAAAGGQALAAASVRLIPASRSAAFLLLNPVVATVLSFVLLGERPSPTQLAGGLLVLLGISAATLRSTDEKIGGPPVHSRTAE